MRVTRSRGLSPGRRGGQRAAGLGPRGSLIYRGAVAHVDVASAIRGQRGAWGAGVGVRTVRGQRRLRWAEPGRREGEEEQLVPLRRAHLP